MVVEKTETLILQIDLSISLSDFLHIILSIYVSVTYLNKDIAVQYLDIYIYGAVTPNPMNCSLS